MSTYEPRSTWGAKGAGGYQMGKAYELIAHHFYRPHVPADATVSREREVMRSVENFHVQSFYGGDATRGGGTGYQFVVFQSGRAYEGRGWFRTGAHTEGRNSQSVAVCFAIDGDSHTPTDAAWATARAIVAEGVEVGAVDEDYAISGHTDYSGKSCPGARTFPLIAANLRVHKEPPVKEYAQCVVGKTTADLEAGRVLAAAYDWALVKAVGESKIVTEQGEEARGGFGICVGSAQKLVRPEHFPDGGLVIAGKDRTETARLIAQTLLKHPPGSIVRRGKPW